MKKILIAIVLMSVMIAVPVFAGCGGGQGCGPQSLQLYSLSAGSYVTVGSISIGNSGSGAAAYNESLAIVKFDQDPTVMTYASSSGETISYGLSFAAQGGTASAFGWFTNTW